MRSSEVLGKSEVSLVDSRGTLPVHTSLAVGESEATLHTSCLKTNSKLTGSIRLMRNLKRRQQQQRIALTAGSCPQCKRRQEMHRRQFLSSRKLCDVR